MPYNVNNMRIRTSMDFSSDELAEIDKAIVSSPCRSRASFFIYLLRERETNNILLEVADLSRRNLKASGDIINIVKRGFTDLLNKKRK